VYQIVLFTIVCVLSLVLNLHCVVHSISVCVWAPGLALRGVSADDMVRAVEGMKDERISAFQVLTFRYGALLPHFIDLPFI